jgi:hypothetical protein
VTVLVGPLSNRKLPTAHMVSTAGVQELHEFADLCAVSRWRYHNGRHKHYDLGPAQRTMAVYLGATAVDLGATAVDTDKELMRRLDGDK